MELDMNLQIDVDKDEADTRKRVKQAENVVKAQQWQPQWEEVWTTGFTRPTGTFKKGIFQTKLTDIDKKRLVEVKEATETGEISIGVDNLSRYTKAHAQRKYKELSLIRRDSIITELMADIPDNYHLINTRKDFHKLCEDLAKESEIAIDTETTGLNYFETYEHDGDNVVGISITLPDADYHVYIPFGHTSKGTQLPEWEVIDGLKPALESESIKKILFNAKFDIHMLRRHGIILGGFHFDAFIGMKLLNENEPSYSLKNLATKYGRFFGFEDDSQTYEELFGKGGFQDAEFERDGKAWIGTLYACKDTHLTYEFYKKFISVHFDRLPKIKDLYYNIEKPNLLISVEMEQNGFMLDTRFAEEYAKELESTIAEYSQKLKEYFGDININSNQQLQRVIYDELGLPDVSKKRQVDAKTLNRLAQYHEGIRVLLKYRDVNKLLTTYIAPLPLKVSKHDGRLHGEFNQIDTETGRYASKNPNLQNIPKNARNMIVAPKGTVIFGMDFSQIEPRVLAHMANDRKLIEAYNAGKDLYTEMAMSVFNLDRKYCLDGADSPCGTYKPRDRVKIIYLGVMYGMGAFSLSQNLDSTVEEAEEHIENFFNTYSDVKEFVQRTHEEADAYEFVETMYGRKRRFVGHRTLADKFNRINNDIIEILGREPKFIWDEEGVPYKLKQAYWDVAGNYRSVNRQSVNTKIQGTSADIMKLALYAVYKVCKKYGFKILATIHDEVLLEVPESITREQTEELEQAMLNVAELVVPLKVDTDFQYKWGKPVSKEEWYSGIKPER